MTRKNMLCALDIPVGITLNVCKYQIGQSTQRGNGNAKYVKITKHCNAKFLWKRTPDEIKLSTPELAKLWNVGCHIWKRDFVAVYNALKEEWSPSIQPIIAALTEKLQKRTFDLVSNAYTSIRAEDLAKLMGITREAALSAAVTSGWISDPATGMITPKKTELPQKEIPLTSEQELALLTDYVSFLEN
nr:COP9 signalosome complex subunit 8-like [Pocillopora verrucosa]